MITISRSYEDLIKCGNVDLRNCIINDVSDQYELTKLGSVRFYGSIKQNIHMKNIINDQEMAKPEVYNHTDDASLYKYYDYYYLNDMYKEDDIIHFVIDVDKLLENVDILQGVVSSYDIIYAKKEIFDNQMWNFCNNTKIADEYFLWKITNGNIIYAYKYYNKFRDNIENSNKIAYNRKLTVDVCKNGDIYINNHRIVNFHLNESIAIELFGTDRRIISDEIFQAYTMSDIGYIYMDLGENNKQNYKLKTITKGDVVFENYGNNGWRKLEDNENIEYCEKLKLRARMKYGSEIISMELSEC